MAEILTHVSNIDSGPSGDACAFDSVKNFDCSEKIIKSSSSITNL